MRAVITVMPKREILDPQSRAIAAMLERLGFHGITDLRVGKRIVIELQETDTRHARRTLENMCTTLLVNDLIEEHHTDLQPSEPPVTPPPADTN